ncbi:ComEC family competence protein [Flavobacteriales bacterium]|nr:ComEC family competence protein [Flavobacteriales bacterium]
MNKLKEIPLLLYLVPFIFGIVLEIYISNNSSVTCVFFVTIICLLSFSFLSKRISLLFNDYPLLFNLIIIFLFFMGGMVLVQFHTKSNYENYFKNYKNSKSLHRVQIIKPIRIKTKSIQCEVEVLELINNDSSFSVNGRALLYLEKNFESLALLQGDIIEFKTKWNNVNPPKNPGQFNYQRYLKFHHIYYQSFLESSSWKIVQRNIYNPFTFSNICRNYFLNLIKKSGVQGDQFAVVSALSLGYKDELSSQLKHSYSSAGAMHVLAVSGLHVGIVYGLLNFILGVLFPLKRMIVLKSIVILIFLWMYALLAGLSPSILRATIMVSFVIVGITINRDSSIYNNIAASAFLLLFLNPYIIMQVGFQLSYLAVLGILYYQPKIYKVLKFRNYFVNKIWIITSVSLAAQLATFPVSLLYFHQFPVYFIFSNLIVIPAAFIVLVSVLSLLVFQFFNPLYLLIGNLINHILYYVNLVVKFIDKSPFSLIEGVSISILETYLIFFLIISATLALNSRKFIFIDCFLFFLLIIGFIDLNESVGLKLKREIVVYNSSKSIAINLYFNGNHVFIADSALFNNDAQMLFNVKHHWFDLDVKETTYLRTKDLSTIGIVNDSVPIIEFNIEESSGFDYFFRFLNPNDSLVNSHEILLISGREKLNYKFLIKHFSKNKWIGCSDLSSSQQRKLIGITNENNIDYEDANENAYIFNL